MKLLTSILTIALVLVGLGLVLTSKDTEPPISTNPEALRLCEEGTEDLMAFRISTALDKLDRSLALDPYLAEAAIARAFVLGRQGLIPELVLGIAHADSLTELIENDKRRMLAQLRLSEVEVSSFLSYRDSLLTQLRKICPENLYVLVAEASDIQRKGNVDASRRAWRRILEVNPDYANSYNMLGYLELFAGNYDQAKKYMIKYAFLAPDEANPHDSLADVLMVLGQYEEAEKSYRKALEILPDFYASQTKLAQTYLARGQMKTNVEILRSIRSELPSPALQMEIDRQILRSYRTMDMTDELVQGMQTFITQHPDDEAVPFYQAYILATKGQLVESQAVIDSVIANQWTQKTDKKSPLTNSNIDRAVIRYEARIADLTEPPETRVKKWRKVLALSSKEAADFHRWPVELDLARALTDNGQYKESLFFVLGMLEVNQRQMMALVVATDNYIGLKKIKPAQKVFKKLKDTLEHADPDLPVRAEAARLLFELQKLEKSL